MTDTDVTPGAALDQLVEMVNSFFRLIPNILIGLVVFLIFWFVAGLIQRSVRGVSERARLTDDAALVFGRIARYVTISTGLFIALAVVIPSITPASLLGAVGFGSVAIGFAFRDILQNFLAGLLLLLTNPFEIGDQIIVGSFEGTVERIETRATRLRTYDGRVVVIPNSDLFTDSVIVNTADEMRRSEYDVGIGYGDDIDRAREVMLAALEGIEGIESEPAPEVLVVDLAESWVTLRARWWTDSARSSVIHVQDRVLGAIAAALTDAGIDMPFPTQVLLFHDQTEETDGDRRRQREGWPAGDGEVPTPRKIADALAGRKTG